MKKKRQGLNRYNALQHDRKSKKTVKQHHTKSEAKQEHQLRPDGP